jgi:hypothetical protein
MKRILLNLLIISILTFTTTASHAGCWFGINLWPFFSFGIGCGGYSPGCYPTYASCGHPAYASCAYPVNRYPVYSYAYAPVAYSQPVYAYRVVRPYNPVFVAVAPTPAFRPAVPVASYAYVRPATVPIAQPGYAPVAPAPPVMAGRPVARTWVVDAQPYRYIPPPHPVAPPVNYVAAQ